MDGFILIDKKTGYTSTHAVRKIKKFVKPKKVGHCGTLDPLATGLLIICVGEATKASSILIGSKKIYETSFELGKETNSYDIDGEIVSEKSYDNISFSDIEKNIETFKGEIEQRPPIFSALKIDGVRSYKRARKGEKFEIAERKVIIYSIKLDYCKLPFIRMTVECGSGTYIRSLVHDLGQKLGCGAVLTGLKRLNQGYFELNKSTCLDHIENKDDIKNKIVSLSEGLSFLPAVFCDDDTSRKVKNGLRLYGKNLSTINFDYLKKDQLMCYREKDGKIIALGRALTDFSNSDIKNQNKVVDLRQPLSIDRVFVFDKIC